MNKTRFLLLVSYMLVSLSNTASAGIISTGAVTGYWGSTSNNIITQAFNLIDSTSETVLDSFDLHVKASGTSTYNGVLFELQGGSMSILSRVDLGSATIVGAHDQKVSFTVGQTLDVSKTYGVGLWASSGGSHWGVTAKSSDAQWMNHAYWAEPSAVVGACPSNGCSADWSVDFAANLNMSSAVPEPSIIALFAIGLFGIGFVRRRQS
jgi:hypothetical protein